MPHTDGRPPGSCAGNTAIGLSDYVRLCAKRPGATKPAQTTLCRNALELDRLQKCSSNAPFAPRHRELEHRDFQDFRVGETGFEPATARPPAGAIQLRGLAFGGVEHL
jgi:hypothetical protein